jgi:hypothetical protein
VAANRLPVQAAADVFANASPESPRVVKADDDGVATGSGWDCWRRLRLGAALAFHESR